MIQRSGHENIRFGRIWSQDDKIIKQELRTPFACTLDFDPKSSRLAVGPSRSKPVRPDRVYLEPKSFEIGG